MARSKCDDELRQTLKEQEWKTKPTDKDYKRAKKLLSDFGVTIEDDLPEFNSIIQLQNFTKSAIRDYLEGLAI